MSVSAGNSRSESVVVPCQFCDISDRLSLYRTNFFCLCHFNDLHLNFKNCSFLIFYDYIQYTHWFILNCFEFVSSCEELVHQSKIKSAGKVSMCQTSTCKGDSKRASEESF